MTCDRCHGTGELYRQDCGAHGLTVPCPSCAMDELIAGDADLYDVPGGAMLPEQCVMVCPQCDGEGTYADGLDDAACSTICTRCEGNGWIVDVHSFNYASARIKGDKDRSVQSSAPTEIERLRDAIRWIADAGYVDHQSGNANFEYLQSVARGALGEGRKDG